MWSSLRGRFVTLLFTPPRSSSLFLAIKGFDLNRDERAKRLERANKDSKNSLFFGWIIGFFLSLSLFFSLFLSLLLLVSFV